MKLVVGVIKPFKLDDVREELSKIGINGLTVSDVKGVGHQEEASSDSMKKHVVDFLPKLKLEVAVDEKILNEVIAAISKGAITDTIGDGKVFVYHLEEIVRIRTGETGPEAI